MSEMNCRRFIIAIRIAQLSNEQNDLDDFHHCCDLENTDNDTCSAVDYVHVRKGFVDHTTRM